MGAYLERYQAGEHVAVWDELVALGEGVRQELYYEDAAAVAAETMRRARLNVETLIQRLHARGYRFLDTVSSAQDRLSQLDVMSQLAARIEERAAHAPSLMNVHSKQMLEGMQAMQARMAPLLEHAAARAAKAAAMQRRPPIEDSQVFSPPDVRTPRMLARLEKALGGPLPLSLRAWYEQVGGVSLMGSDPVVNAVDFANRNVLQQFDRLAAGHAPPEPTGTGEYAPDPLVIFPLEALMAEMSGGDDASNGQKVQLTISPDDLHKANVSGDAYYITLPDARADFQFDDWHGTTFVNYLRAVFRWGGFPGWERSENPPRREIAELSEGLLAI